MKNAFTISVLAVFLTAVSCKLVTENEGDTQGIRGFKLAANEVSGWTESSYFEFNTSNCFSDAGLNGGAKDFTDNGMIEGFRQKMVSSDYLADIIITDFGSNSNSTKMFNFKSSTSDDGQKVGNYAETVAFMDENLSGVNAYAHFGKYYFIVQLSGYSIKADARSTAASFLELYENKTASNE
ncbi:MAG: hypothetical protein GX556_12565 [Fibrobacter sp.]|nr:hypothetical protein [Fibrobacter sp.]